MPLIKKKSNVETGTLGKTRISKELYTRLERYCAFTGRRWEERHEVIEVLLRYALDHDADFKKEADADPNLALKLPKPARQTKEKVAAATQTP